MSCNAGPGASHHTGCACHEARRDAELAAAMAVVKAARYLTRDFVWLMAARTKPQWDEFTGPARKSLDDLHAALNALALDHTRTEKDADG